MKRSLHGRRMLAFAAIATASAASMGCHRAPDTDPRLVPEWIHTLYGMVRAERLSPPVGSRIFVYASTALYAGITAAEPRRPALSGLMNGLPELPHVESTRDHDPTLTAIAAERVTLDSLLREALPTTRSAVSRLADSLESARVAQGVSERVRTNSKRLGESIGNAIMAWAHADGFDSTRGLKYVPPVGRGLWVNDTPVSNYTTQNVSGVTEMVTIDNPANARRSSNSSDRGLILSRPKRAGTGTLPAVNMAGATEPYWGTLRPFALEKWDECPVEALPPFSTSPGSKTFEEAKLVYEIGKNLTPEQKSIALFWADNAGETGTPTGHWLSIAGQMVGEKHLPAPEAARMMMLTSVALADAFIATWGYKFRINLIRPRTYIRSVMDSTWEPAIPTPPFPEYVSGHSAISAAAATALTSVLGPVAFHDSTSIFLGHAVRAFASFTEAAHEAGQSRIYGGIHFPSGNLAGRALGECVGEKVIARLKAARAP